MLLDHANRRSHRMAFRRGNLGAMAETMSDVFDVRTARRGGAQPVLHVVLRGGAPLDESSRHSLDGVDIVCFARGDRGASRVVRSGLRHLVLSVPDPLMSSDHGRLVHAQRRWMLGRRRPPT
jgi:hypothetical protein